MPDRAAIFDIGNVVLFFSHEKMCLQLGACFGLEAQEVHRRLFETDFVARYDRGLASTREMFETLAAAGCRAPSEREARRAAADIFSVNAEMEPILRGLQASGVRLVALSNTCEVHARHVLARFEILESFDHLVLSHEVGMTKPDAAIFALAAARAGCAPGACFFTDDVADYVAAARRAGLDAELFVDAGTTAAALRARGYALGSGAAGRQPPGV